MNVSQRLTHLAIFHGEPWKSSQWPRSTWSYGTWIDQWGARSHCLSTFGDNGRRLAAIKQMVGNFHVHQLYISKVSNKSIKVQYNGSYSLCVVHTHKVGVSMVWVSIFNMIFMNITRKFKIFCTPSAEIHMPSIEIKKLNVSWNFFQLSCLLVMFYNECI